ncbi:MAG: response regulator [Deltaproteobacteria bacterium]|nr:response regulator [Deltaproteobacteria bacterium]
MNAELMALFVSSATDRLTRMIQSAAGAGASADSEGVIRQIRRDLHTLKGESTVLDLGYMTDLIHATEGRFRRETGDAPAAAWAILGEVLDLLLTCVSCVGESKPAPTDDVRKLVARLGASADASPPAGSTPNASASSPAQGTTTPEAQRSSVAQPATPREAQASSTVQTAPTAERVVLTTERAVPTTERAVPTAERGVPVSGTTTASTSAPLATSEASRERSQESQTAEAPSPSAVSVVRVRAQVLDGMTEFVNQIAGGLVRNADYFRALQEVQLATEDRASARRIAEILRDLRENAFWMDRSCNSLAHEIRDVRLRPLETILVQYPMFVRRAGAEVGKNISFRAEGGQVRLDQRVLEQISEPMLHLVRNAIVHGIETSDVRRSLGKPSDGTISLSATEDGGFARIEFRDDGGGIDCARLVRRAVALRLLDEEQAQRMSLAEQVGLIFTPNLSSLSDAGTLGGRGVGLDVVKAVIDQMGGHVDVESEQGVGTRFVLHVPVSRSLSRALLVEVSGQLFAFPNVSVVATAWLPVSEIRNVDGIEAMTFRGKLVSLVRLRSVLRLSGVKDLFTNKLPVVIVSSGNHTAGFVVDRYVGERELVIRPLGAFLGRPDLLGGVSVLENSDVVLILHPPSVLRAVGEGYGAQGDAGAGGRMMQEHDGSTAMNVVRDRSEIGRGRRVLYAEDSFTTRKYSADVMRSRGYEVVEASDGAEALAILEKEKFDVVLTDLQMPGVDGFTVIRRIRATPRLQNLPVIVLSTLATDETKRLALNAGADVYLVKSAFAAETLMSALDEVLHA